MNRTEFFDDLTFAAYSQFANCKFDTVKLSQDDIDQDKEMCRLGVVAGDSWPAIVTKRSIRRGEELLLDSYGGGYWKRYLKECVMVADGETIFRHNTLMPQHVRFLRELRLHRRERDRRDQRNDDHQRRASKRQRSEEDDLSDTRQRKRLRGKI